MHSATRAQVSSWQGGPPPPPPPPLRLPAAHFQDRPEVAEEEASEGKASVRTGGGSGRGTRRRQGLSFQTLVLYEQLER
ncbi:hypothetical protein EYF80_025575 [Liparis tanakae]|uniref:Uncharacterized protein n=1 Tax=Liparis tanakae TaxID=230148 RepID=A0A4Z2HEA9_9TELE|nr:hypothetical protein EYF80_025575 [Liparis tanakae]